MPYLMGADSLLTGVVKDRKKKKSFQNLFVFALLFKKRKVL